MTKVLILVLWLGVWCMVQAGEKPKGARGPDPDYTSLPLSPGLTVTSQPLVYAPHLTGNMKPTISADLRARAWRALAELNAIKPQFEAKQAAVNHAEAEMRKACGELQLHINASGEPDCIEKPAEKAEKK